MPYNRIIKNGVSTGGISNRPIRNDKDTASVALLKQPLASNKTIQYDLWKNIFSSRTITMTSDYSLTPLASKDKKMHLMHGEIVYRFESNVFHSFTDQHISVAL